MDILIQRRAMILEYFNITISETGELSTLPLLLKMYTPNYGKLPLFLRRLGQNVPPLSSCPLLHPFLPFLFPFSLHVPTFQ
jgi:DNA mismatch repair protein MLH1